MTVLFDIKHVAHVNFFKPVILKLKNDGFEVIISYIKRGKLPKIIMTEFEGIPSYDIGSHKGTKASIIFDANILKFFKGYSLLNKKNIKLMLGVDAFVTGLGCKLRGIPNLQFYDDPERRINLWLEQKTSSEVYYPEITDFSGTSVKTYRALKEWAYLSPSYFNPKPHILKEYELEKKGYIFVREVDNGTLNYMGQDSATIASVSDRFPKGVKVILSLENKTHKNHYPKDWTILEEPVPDIHSLMYYSKAIVSSGDSMAREGAMLGVPSFYVGFRDMAANRFIQKEGRFFVVSPADLSDSLRGTISFDFSQEEYRNNLQEKWVDVTYMMYELVKKYLSK